MLLQALPLVFVLVGLALYTVLGGADFGAGFWQLLAGPGPTRRADPRARPPLDGPGVGGQPRLADLRADRVLDRVPEARSARSPRRSAVPLFIAALGIIFRGAAYALRAGASSDRESRRDRHDLLALLDPDPVRARRGGRRDRHRPRAGRQRRRGTCSRAG